ncbi:hypothetical protein HA402_010911 [Bradysia odoriphaga]|nr:hypothetical protein HA402_010911 [Bradysia odoriphaga]
MRYVIASMICLGCMINNIVRGNMSIIILAMTKPLYNTTAGALPDYGPRYAWSAYEQSLVIGSYFWGGTVTMFIAGIFAERYGARKVIGFGIITAAILSGVAPVAANYLWLSIVVRFCSGMAMATVSPSMQALISNWAPPEEKGKFLSAYLANGIGTVIDWSISGYIIKYLGWDYAFYVVVLILGIYALAWYCIVYDSPKKHPYISTEEKEFILSKVKMTATKKPWPPIKSMMISVPFWALVIFHFGILFAQFIFLTAAPKYLSEVHHFDIATTGLLSSIPYLARFIFGIGFGFLGDYMFKNQVLSPKSIRKGFAVCSHILPACFLIGLMFVNNRPFVSITFISLALGFSGAISITSMQNPHDLSPNFATTIFAFIHTVGSASGFIAPMVIAHFTKIKSSDEEWQYVFLIGAATLVTSAIIFIVFGGVTVQKWNKIDNEKTDMKLLSPLAPLAEFEKTKL